MNTYANRILVRLSAALRCAVLIGCMLLAACGATSGANTGDATAIAPPAESTADAPAEASASAGTSAAATTGRDTRAGASFDVLQLNLCNSGHAPKCFHQNAAVTKGIELMEFAAGLGAKQPTVVGGDFNLKHQGEPDAQDCVPAGWFRKGDGSVQHVMAREAHFGFERTTTLPMDGLTDHPGLLVELTLKERHGMRPVPLLQRDR